MATIFDILKRITYSKENWEDLPQEEQEAFNKYMINRFISMDQDYCEVVNVVQKNMWQMDNAHIYRLYKNILPKRQVFLKYMKPTKVKYDPEAIELIKEYFETGNKEAKEYLDILSKEEIQSIFEQYGK